MSTKEFNYTREWTDAEAFPLLSFTKSWENPEDYPTYEPDEMQVRRDMQSLHDEVKDFLNNDLIPRVVAEDATVDAWNAMEQARQEAETSRVNAETARVEAETARATAESERMQAEFERAVAEFGRVSAEDSRASAEALRETKDAERSSAEAVRNTAEEGRVVTETKRVRAESERRSEFTAMQSAESRRAEAETLRSQAEKSRESAENIRKNNENLRLAAEAKREAAESVRVSAEATRVTQESARVAAENARVAAEKQRANAESARVNAEQARENQETGYVAQAKAYAESAAKSAQEAKDATDFATRPEAQGYANTAESNANKYTDQRIAAIPTPDVSGQINAHNTNTSAHSDIRTAVSSAASAASTAQTTANSKVAKTDIVQDVGAATNKVMSQKAVTDKFNGYVIPGYWQAYLDGKISDIKALQDVGGKDCFSFVVMTDLHYPSNLGKRSPDLARKIMDEINAKYAICLGDVQTRGCLHTKDEVVSELTSVEAFFAPIKDRLLRTQGNHDGSYGWLDRDGDGQYTNTGKEPADRETYVYNLTPAEIFERIYRPNGMVGDIHTDESGTGYYIDDTANRVRYIVLNTQKNDYELQEDGTQKYPNMWLFRFTQSQFDFLTKDALVTGLTDAWSVVVLGHCPLYQEIGDREVMQGVLNAYKNKTTYKGSYVGTASGGTHIVKEYTNLAEPLPDNKTDTTKWVNGYRFGSAGTASAQSGTTLSNMIPCKTGDVIRIKGVSLRESTDRVILGVINADGEAKTPAGYFQNGVPSAGATIVSYDGLEDGVYKFTVGTYDGAINYFRFAMPTPEDTSAVIITVNEEIKETVVSVGGYDSVFVYVDFTAAKGNLVGYFAGHVHVDNNTVTGGVPVITTRCDAKEENTDALKTERVAGTTTEQSFDVFTVNTKTKTIHATKIGAGNDRTISY